MSKKPEVNITCCTSDKLYCKNKFYIEKEIISTYIYHPAEKQKFQYKFHFGELVEEGCNYHHTNLRIKQPAGKGTSCLKESLEHYNLINKNQYFYVEEKDLNDEIFKYCPYPQDQKVYFFMEVLDEKGNNVPSYKAFLHINNLQEFKELNQNLDNFKEIYNFQFRCFLDKGIIDFSVVSNFEQCLFLINQAITNYKEANYESAKKEIITNKFLKILNEIKQKETYPLYYFLCDIVDSFINKEANDFLKILFIMEWLNLKIIFLKVNMNH